MAEKAEDVAAPAAVPLPLRLSDDIQGNILASFNKPCQRFLFISFMNRRAEARNWLRALVGEGVASTKQVFEHSEAYKQARREGGKLDPQQWVGVSFTSSGLVTLDPDVARGLVPFEGFWRGPLVDREYRGERRTSPAVVGDVRRGDPTRWVVGGPGQYPVDALVTIAGDDDDGFLTRAEDERARAADAGLAVLSWQDCRRRDGGDHGIEPFGFRDGISQPGVRGFTEPEDRNGHREAAEQAGTPIIAAGEFVLGHDGEGGSYPDGGRPVPPGWMRDGSFQVFLRLRQDVEGWEAQMRELSASSGGTVDAAATAIGRRPDGEPLAARGESRGLNDFTFEDDPRGQRTPRFAHIRKMNPRNGTFDDRTHRVLRRGIPFATPLDVGTRLPGDEEVAGPAVAEPVEHGMAFNAFMASIEDQFEFLQRSWANNPDSLPPVAADGPDPVIGVSDAPCVLRRENADPVEIDFGRSVWTSGVVYAFAPSLPELRRLAGPDPVRVEGT